MNLEKYATPLTIAAAFLAIYAFTRTLKPQSEFVAGALPNPLTVPSGTGVPAITYNVATPTPPPIQPGSGFVPFVPPNGVSTGKGFGVSLPSDPNQVGCGCKPASSNTPAASGNQDSSNFRWNWGDTVYMNSAIL